MTSRWKVEYEVKSMPGAKFTVWTFGVSSKDVEKDLRQRVNEPIKIISIDEEEE